MQKDALVAAMVVLLAGILMIPISQWPKTEMRERLEAKQTIQIPEGESSFEASLKSDSKYRLFVKGGLISPDDPVKIEVTGPDNTTFHVEFPIEDPKSDFQTFGLGGSYNFTFESAYAGPNTRAEISEIVSWEVVVHPYDKLLYVGIAFVIVGTAFVVIGLRYPIKGKTGK